jgi:flagellar hook-basal body complex protein FliE
LEVVGAVSAASGLLEAAISVIKRVRKAYERQRELASVLDSYNDELVTIKGVLQIVRDEESLRTAAVASQLDGIESLARKLNMCLQALDPGAKGFVRQFTHQLAHGSKEEKALADIMDALGHAKSDLSLHVQVANVGLIRTVGDKLVANAEVIGRVDLVLQQVFGEGRGLKIAALLKNKHPQGTFGCTSPTKILKVDR